MVKKMAKTISELLLEQNKKAGLTMASDMQDHNKLLSDEEAKNYINNEVVELLKKSLNIHWQQTTVLSAQAVHLERWGYAKLSAVVKADAKQEHEHAMINLSRLEFFDADYQPLVVNPPSWTRHDMIAMIQYNLASVQEASAAERATIVAARAVGDEMTANIMIPLLQGSEEGIILYEGFLKLIEQMGLDNFLSIQA
jgi:bacterioferritin (cytochrome b1)